MLIWYEIHFMLVITEIKSLFISSNQMIFKLGWFLYITWWWDFLVDLKISNVHVQSMHICKVQTVQNENLYFSKYKCWGLYKWTYYSKSLFSADLYIVWNLAISAIFFKLHYASQDFEIFFEYFSALFKDLLYREL